MHFTPWTDATFVAIDLETTGKYPLDAEICEMAAVKWKNGQVIDTFQSLIKPTHQMGAECISIHNITNEMVENSPRIGEKLGEFHKFIQDDYIIAHHSPFDMGFLAWEFEKARLPLPANPVFCTSLFSQAVNYNTANHRLATLAEYFKIPAGQAHRAMDDAKTCLAVALKFFEKFGPEAKVQDLLNAQQTQLLWPRYSIEALMERDHFRVLVRSLVDRFEVTITYESGSRPGEPRKVFPMGLVRSLAGDFLVATEGNNPGDEIHPKRYFLQHISKVVPAASLF